MVIHKTNKMIYLQSLFKKISFLLILVFLSTIGYSQIYNGKQKEIDKILENISAFSEFYMNSDTEGIVNCYTTDGTIFPSNQKILRGEDALRKFWTVPEKVKILHHKITPEEITVKGKTAYDYGYYEGKTQRPDGSVNEWQGKYVIVWKKVNKEWKIYLDIWNQVDK